MKADIVELLGRIVEIGKIKAKLTASCSRLDIEVMEKLCGTLKGRKGIRGLCDQVEEVR